MPLNSTAIVILNRPQATFLLSHLVSNLTHCYPVHGCTTSGLVITVPAHGYRHTCLANG